MASSELAKRGSSNDYKKSDCCDAGVWISIVLRVDPPSSQFDLLPVEIEKTNLVHLGCTKCSWNGVEIEI